MSEWEAVGNCTRNCRPAYRTLRRQCIDSLSSQSCDISRCGNQPTSDNDACSHLPLCASKFDFFDHIALQKRLHLSSDQTLNLTNTTRDPSIRITSYLLPNQMYFFDRSYSRIWVGQLILLMTSFPRDIVFR